MQPWTSATPIVSPRGRRSRSGARRDPRSEAWRRRAACRGLDPAIFHPETEEEAEQAKAVCGVCVVRGACLEYALSASEPVGVWGGLTGRERRRMRRRRRRSA